MKIANYIQSYSYQNKEEFDKAIKAIKDIDFDILVLPELSYVPIEHIVSKHKCEVKTKNGKTIKDRYIDSYININIFDENEVNNVLRVEALKLSGEIGKAVVFGNKDKNGNIFSVFVNAFAKGDDTTFKYHIKHTFQGNDYSILDKDRNDNHFMFTTNCFELFEKDFNLQLIYYKGKRIALSICYDCHYSLFTNACKLLKGGIDIIINCTGGDVIFSKWFRSNKVRSIENNCFTFLTMGINKEKEEKNKHDYSFGITPNGYELKPKKIYSLVGEQGNGSKYNESGAIYLYDVIDNGETQKDLYLLSESKDNNKTLLTIPFNKTTDEKFKQEFLKENDIKIINIFKKDIYNPMKYIPELVNEEHKGYVLTIEYDDLSIDEFETKLSDVLKEIAVWNHITVLLNSDIKKIRYCGTNRNSPQTFIEKECYHVDITKTKGLSSDRELNKSATRMENYKWLTRLITPCLNWTW